MDRSRKPTWQFLFFVMLGIQSVPSAVQAERLDPYLPIIEKTGGWYLTESAVVSGSDVKSGIVYAVIDAPQAHLVGILRTYDRYRELIPFLSDSKVINQPTPTTAELKLRAKILKGALKLRTVVSAQETHPSKDVTRFMLKKKSGNLERLDAKFSVQKLGAGRSIVRIELLLDPDVWYVRDATLSEYNQVNARRIARALKKAAQERTFQRVDPPESAPIKQPNSVQPPQHTETKTP